MTVYQVDGADLGAIASAIRSRTGATGSLSFPYGFVKGFDQTVELEPEALFGELPGSFTCDASVVRDYAFYACTSLASVNFPVCASVGSNAFYSCSSLTSVSFPICMSVGSYAFARCSSLTSVSFPICMTIGGYAFVECSNLTSANFPSCTTIGSYAFCSCSSLASANFPVCMSMSSNAFRSCINLTSASFPICASIGSSAFYSDYNLVSLYLTSVSSVPALGSYAFSSTPIGGYSASAGRYGSVYVPSSLYSSFLTATNWSVISSRIVSV